MPQAGCYLSAVFNRKQAEVAVSLLEHEAVSLPNLFGGGLEVERLIGEAWLKKGSLCFVGCLAGFCSHELREGGISGALHLQIESCSRYRFFL